MKRLLKDYLNEFFIQPAKNPRHWALVLIVGTIVNLILK